MNIAVIDADLIGRKKHRFPNLSCMKISGFYKSYGDSVILKTDYSGLNDFDRVYVSKVFTDTPVNNKIYSTTNLIYGGTGFYFDQSPSLPNDIEHSKPDYNLYDNWIAGRERANGLEYYKDYSIGFLTRHCFRGCFFCVNKNYKKVDFNANLEEFLDINKKYICLLDDNFLGYRDWKQLLNQLIETKKPFQFKQGLDLRLMTEEKAEILSNCKYKGDYIFAFDKVEESGIIQKKLKLWKSYCNKTTKFYVFCGYENTIQDIVNVFERIKILMKHGCSLYVMRHENYTNHKHYGIYINLARWGNQPSFYKKMTFRKFCEENGENSGTMKYLRNFELEYPDIAKMYFDLRYEDLNEYNNTLSTIRR